MNRQPNSPTVSVVIPCYDGARFLRATIESVLAQTHPVLEIIVVDDGSTDDSAAIAESFGSPVRVIRQPNQGESVARNRGIDEARGEWIAFQDADDIWEPQKTAKQLAGLAPGARASCTGFYDFQEPGGQILRQSIPRAENMNWEAALTNVANPCLIIGVMVRRELKARFPVGILYGEDMIYVLSVLKETPIAIVPELLVGYRRYAGSQSTRRLIQIQWYESVVGWLRQQPDLPPADLARYERSMLQMVLRGCTDAYIARDWVLLEEYNRYLAPFIESGDLNVQLPRRRYPDWTYSTIDSAKKFIRRTPWLRRWMRLAPKRWKDI